MVCLDTNVVIFALSGRYPKIVERLERTIFETTVGLSTIVVYELLAGVASSTHREANRRRLRDFLGLPIAILDFSADDAEHAADIRADLKRSGTPIGPYDVLIAAQARCRGATLVTGNTREFIRVPHLTLDDWTQTT